MKNKYIKFKQIAGLGDILFLEPIARKFYNEGFKIYWPVTKCYYEDVKRHIPYIDWVIYNSSDDFKVEKTYDFEDSYWKWHNKTGCRIMEAKYKVVDMDIEMWRTFKYKRNLDKENQLIEELNLDINKPYSLRHLEYGTPQSDKAEKVGTFMNNQIDKNNNMKTVDIDYMDGYSILDWSTIIENAYDIRFVSTCTLYLVETLNLINNPELHLYARSQDPNLIETGYLCNKNWKIHTL